MKHKWHHPEQPADQPKVWRGQDSLRQTPAAQQWKEREFPAIPTPADADGQTNSDGISRREFNRLMAASTALAGMGLASCRRPEAYLVPYTNNVEWIIPGKALFYSSAMPWRDGAVPLVVTTHEGRPTKLDGNPLHPNSSGTSDSWTQAAILDLYDPDRSQHALVRGQQADMWNIDSGLGLLRQDLSANRGGGVGILVGHAPSPTRSRLLAQLKSRFPNLRIYRYESLHPVSRDRALDAAFGRGVRSLPRYEKIKRVLSLDCDFLGVEKETMDTPAAFAKSRRPEEHDLTQRGDDMARLYVAEPAFTVTGGMADHRKRVPSSQIVRLAALLAAEVARLKGRNDLAALVSGLGIDAGDHASLDPRWIRAAAEDLASTPGAAAVVAGERQPEAVHMLAAAINHALGAFGPEGCIDLVQTQQDEAADLAALASDIEEGAVTTLLSLTPADPAYDAPGDLDWPALRRRLTRFVHWGARVNRTATEADLHIPAAHFLESWGDVVDAHGTYSIVQPMILPLYDGRSELGVLSSLLANPGAADDEINDPELAREAVRETFRTMGGAENEFNNRWNQALRDGFLADTAHPLLPAVAPDTSAFADWASAALNSGSEGEYEILFATDPSIFDGRFINNGWLQEAPDPVTKLTWDNAALMSPATADKLGVNRFIGDGDQRAALLEISVDGSSVTLPALVAYGHADDVITLPMGYGQCDGSADQALPMRVGSGTGFNVNPLRRFAAGRIARGSASRADGLYLLALTQEHGSMEGRAIIREGTTERYQEDPAFAATEGEDAHVPENISFYKNRGFNRDHDVPGFETGTGRFSRPHLFDQRHQWAMVIDLSQCTGCNACLVACQAENNIPIVGKRQVALGREMHWIRMDRYFVAKQDSRGHYQDEDNPAMLMQPVACVQCEQAPCEVVCPVNATVHSEDGLNVMAYNRCIGTRYCANNCPYKARRFNYFDYNKRPLNELYRGPLSSTKGVPESEKLQKNPNVSIRMRGVMEKCTYCIQRLEEAKIKQYSRRRDKPVELGIPSHETSLDWEELRVPANSVKVACQEACPSEAIVFGNLLDPNCDIRRYKFIDMDIERRPIRSLHPRNYDLLNYVGALPRTSYLARIKNPNPAMPDAPLIGNSTISIH